MLPTYSPVLVLTCFVVPPAQSVLFVFPHLSSQDEVKEEARSGAQDKVDKFLASQGSILSKPIDPFKAGGEGEVSRERVLDGVVLGWMEWKRER